MAHDHEKIVYGIDEVKELFDASVMIGTIVNVDYETDKADVEVVGSGLISDIPIFYHCPESSVIEGGSAAFAEDDNVYILSREGRVSAANLKIVGFVDGLKLCGGFRIKLTRGDGILITEESGLLSLIKVYNSSDVLLTITTPEYSIETEYWSFNLVDPGDVDLNGYWVDYLCEDGVLTQYPYRYKEDDKNKEADLIKSGIYEDNIPYWVVTDFESPVPTEQEFIRSSPVDLGPNGIMQSPQLKLYIGSEINYNLGKTVKSSVPYKITYQAVPWSVAGYYYGLRAQNCSYFIVSPGAASDPCSSNICSHIINAENSGRLLLTYFDSSQVYLSIYESVPEDKEENSAGSIEGINHYFGIKDESITEGWLPAYGDPENPSYGPELIYLCTQFVKTDLIVTANYDY